MSTADYLIKGVALPDGRKADLAIAGGVITSVNEGFKGEVETMIDGSNCIVLPGLVDLHTHLREPGREDAETVMSGSRAGAKVVSPLFQRWPIHHQLLIRQVWLSRYTGWVKKRACWMFFQLAQ